MPVLLVSLLCILAIAGTDQLIKVWIVRNMALYEDRPFLQIGNLDLLHLHYIQNDGSAFSSFAGQRVLLLTITTLGTVVAAYLLVKYGRKRPVPFWCLTAIIGGGIGNMIDRIFRGGLVVDYLDVQLFEFAVFNFADCFVTVGTIVLMIYILFFMDKHEKRLKAQENAHDKA